MNVLLDDLGDPKVRTDWPRRLDRVTASSQEVVFVPMTDGSRGRRSSLACCLPCAAWLRRSRPCPATFSPSGEYLDGLLFDRPTNRAQVLSEREVSARLSRRDVLVEAGLAPEAGAEVAFAPLGSVPSANAGR